MFFVRRSQEKDTGDEHVLVDFRIFIYSNLLCDSNDFTWDSVTENGSNLLDSKMRLLKTTDKLTTSFVGAKRTIIVKRKYFTITITKNIFYILKGMKEHVSRQEI